MLGLIFNEILIKPLFNILLFFYGILPDFGAAVILLTVLIRILLLPLTFHATKSQQALMKLRPKIKEIQEKYRHNQTLQARKLRELYQTQKINPFSGCLPILIQLPILLALFRVFSSGLDPSFLSNAYSFISHPAQLDPLFLGVFDLSKKSLFLAFLAGFFQFWQSKLTLPKIPRSDIKKTDPLALVNKQTLYFFPVLTMVFAAALPAALSLYWATSTLIAIFQQLIWMKKLKI